MHLDDHTLEGKARGKNQSDLDEINDDHAVLDACNWPHHLTDEEILEHLLALNLERAEAQEAK